MQSGRSQSRRQSRTDVTDKSTPHGGNRRHRSRSRQPKTPAVLPTSIAVAEQTGDAWRNFVLFIDEAHSDYIPLTEEKRNLRAITAAVERKCIELLLADPGDDWSALVEHNFAEIEARKIALEFFRYVKKASRASDPTPAAFVAQFKLDLDEFVALTEAILAREDGRDPNRLQRFVKLLNRYGSGTASRSFLLLVTLLDVLPAPAATLLQTSPGYHAILQAGSFRSLPTLWRDLQRHFKLDTERDLHKSVAEATAIEQPIAVQAMPAQPVIEQTAVVGFAQPIVEEDPLELRQHLQTAQARIAILEDMVSKTQQQAQQTAIQSFARALQNRPNPALDQLFTLHRWLQKEMNNGVTLSSDLLRIFITLEDVLESFDVVGIASFPSHLEMPFTLQGDQLGEFAYVEGSPFNGRADIKTVTCVRPGWRVGETIITPARVKEVKKKG